MNLVKGRGVDKEECTVTRCVVEEQVNLVSGRGVEQEDYTLTRCVVEEQVNLVSGRGVVQEEYTVGLDRYGSNRYRYRYILPADIFADTDIFAVTYRLPIPIPIFSFYQYFADILFFADISPVFDQYLCILTNILPISV